MDYRARFLNALLGKPADRLPFVEIATFNMVRASSDWNRHLSQRDDPRIVFGFDNAELPQGYEPVPVDWYAVPRFETLGLPDSSDGYLRRIEGRYGRVIKAVPASPENPLGVRVFENHRIKSEGDWEAVKERFHLSAEGRFPPDWQEWCAHSAKAPHPIVLETMDPGAAIANLLGLEGETGLIMSLHDRADFIREMVGHFTRLSGMCAEKALREARVDMVTIGSDLLPLLGPNVVRDFLLDSYTDSVSLARECGIDLICLEGRGDLRPMVDMLGECGVNGLHYVEEAGGDDHLRELLETHGDNLFYVGTIDGRVLRESAQAIEAEVDRKLDLAGTYRMIPCLHVTHILPEVPFENYRHYARYLRKRIMNEAAGRRSGECGNHKSAGTA
jgi:hypothetical protein